jgi:hypothetical protein
MRRHELRINTLVKAVRATGCTKITFFNVSRPYPGLWDYWRADPTGRGGPGDHVRPQDIERLQLTVTPDSDHSATENARGVAIESIRLAFTATP